jgi:hypothetical protein
MGRLPRAGRIAGRTVDVCQTLSPCMKFVFGKERILSVQQLRITSGRWLPIEDLQHNHHWLTADKYASLNSWLEAANPSSAEAMVSDDSRPKPAATCGMPTRQEQRMACTSYAGVMPPCLRDSLVRQFADGQAELELLLDADIPKQSIEHTSDEELA